MNTLPTTRRIAPGASHRRAPDMSAASHRVAVGVAAAAVLAQISYPLLSGEPLRAVTIGSVLLFTAASLTHAGATRGIGAALTLLAVAGGIGLAAEAVGVATGLPFGSYRYAGTLGPDLLGVPLIVPLAWVMMAYPCLLLGRRLARAWTPSDGPRRHATAVALAAFTLAAWDLYLDPQMVAAGHWAWAHPTPALPGVPGIPLTNYGGWLLVALVLTVALDRVIPDRQHPETVPAVLLAWTWLGSALGNLAFFGRPAVAGYGALIMGLTVAPYLRLVLGDRR